MKTLLFLFLILLSFSACKKCYTCSDANGAYSSTQCFTTTKAMTNYENSASTSGDPVTCTPQ
jgi:hypothetical protein